MNHVRDYLELTKPRITVLILMCAAAGYWFGCGNSFHGTILAHALLGTALLASGTSALNQWYEVDSDAKMRRTQRRPMPAGKIARTSGLAEQAIVNWENSERTKFANQLQTGTASPIASKGKSNAG